VIGGTSTLTAASGAAVSGQAHAGELGAALRRAQRPGRWLAWGLLAPSVLFLVMFFVLPILAFLARAVDNADIRASLPRTVEAIAAWHGQEGLPDDAVAAALALDLRALDPQAAAVLGRRLNQLATGYRSLILATYHGLGDSQGAVTVSDLTALDRRWGERRYWATLRQNSGLVTLHHLLASVDLERDENGHLVRVPEERRVFLLVIARTFSISAAVTGLCLLLGFPVALVIARARPATANKLLLLVLLPFWTSVLVRTAAWVILLQQHGLANQALTTLGLVSEPLALIFNRTGVYVAMTHVLLPFMILPLYSVMRRIPSDYMRAAASLGAPPHFAFVRVYLPQVLPGLVAGSTLVFVTSLGYYITPILVGGPSDQMLSYFVAFFTNESVNWGMASALASMLLLLCLLVYAAVGRTVGFQRLRLG